MQQQAQPLKFVYGLFVVFLMAILLLPSALAEAPIIITTGDAGYDLGIPLITTIKQSKDLEICVHVFNKTNGYPVTTGMTCVLHLYNSSGGHIYEASDTTMSHNFDYTFDVDGATNFSELGKYYYIVQCYTDEHGGASEAEIDVTPDGKPLATENIVIFFSILFLILIGGLFALLIYDITRFATLDFDVKDIIFNLSAYFVLFGTYMLQQEYLANENIERFLEMLVTAGAYPFVYLATVMFVVCFIFNLMVARKERKKLK